jgi:hypothetical protein
MMLTEKMPTHADYYADEEARDLLRAMVYHHRHGDEELQVPPRCRPEVAEEFLKQAVKDSLSYEELQRAGDVARFYVLRDSVELFSNLIQNNAQTTHDVLKLIECLRVMGDLGDQAANEEAAVHFDYVLQHREAAPVIDLVIECYFHLDEVGKDDVAKRLEERIAALKKRPGNGTADELVRLEAHLEAALPVTLRAKIHKAKLLADEDRAARAIGLARAYIGLDDLSAIDWPKWAAFEVMAEIERSSVDNVVAGLQSALGEIGDAEKQEFKQYARARGARAITFLGGDLTKVQEGWMSFGQVRRFQLEG